ncbi:hypothetical protein EJ06DRAFT_547185 [Trichodelitschia bisporula]|uniref:Zn(2)-C6 fungal-type domain-containing protein n=1 Tax=Trichodelitschia bisporula TaxID=703511 RepID=A0A6G1I390_9PEZI|nr:hypothetical protein EJ06DRAFT_547185 [Trichodelitschia bisporula]
MDPDPHPEKEKYACALCHTRKVRCDRKAPCANCVRHAAECVYKAPPPPRRTPRKVLRDTGPKTAGADSGSRSGAASTTTSPATTASPDEGGDGEGRLLAGMGMTQYFENGLWGCLDAEITHRQFAPTDPTATPDADSFGGQPGALDPAHLLLSTPCLPNHSVASHYPAPALARSLWAHYLEYVNPICKIIHVPTLLPVFESSLVDPSAVSKYDLALLLCMHVFAVASMTDEMCLARTGEARPPLLARMRYVAQQSLIDVRFLKSFSIVSLQAFCNFVLAMRLLYPGHTLWALTGLALRTGQKLGLHHNAPTSPLRPFDIEMRRRLWRQLLISDHHASELVGISSAPALRPFWSSQMPLALNDADLYPDMPALPPAREGANEMMFCALRNEFGSFMMRARNAHAGGSEALPSQGEVAELEHRLEAKYIRYLDPLVPLHLLCSLAARAAVFGVQLRLRHPRHYADGGASLPKSEKDALFALSVKVLRYDDAAYSMPALEGFRWHVRAFFQWHALIYLLSELRLRTSGGEVDDAWAQVIACFGNHPELAADADDPLHAAVARLALKAWDAREAVLRGDGRETMIPLFVRKCRALHVVRQLPVRNGGAETVVPSVDVVPPVEAMEGIDTESPPLDWAAVLRDFHVPDFESWMGPEFNINVAWS